jgi:hypothetical protein
MEQKVDTFLKSINESIVANIFVSITLGNYKGIIEQLKNIPHFNNHRGLKL